MKRFHHRYTLPLILLLLVLAIMALSLGLINFKRDTTLPSNTNAATIGIELNQNYSIVDLHQLEDHGISFVYFRSTQGKTYFDNDFLTYRDQVLGTNLAYGVAQYYSDESTAEEQYQYFVKKVGMQTGSLPILIKPAVSQRSLKYLQSMAHFVSLLQSQGKLAMVAVNNQYRQYFPKGTLFMATGKKVPNQLQYSFWRYTTDGRVKNVSGLEKGVTMYSYNGTVSQYKHKYGQLTQ